MRAAVAREAASSARCGRASPALARKSRTASDDRNSVGPASDSRQSERRHGVVDLAGHAEGFTAGGEHADTRTRRQEDAREARAGRPEVLTVVEDEEQLGISQASREMRVERLVRGFTDVEGRGRFAGDEGRLRQRGEVDQEDSVRRPRQRSCGGLERNPRLADAADPGQHQQACLIEQPIDLGELGLAADEARDRRRKVVPLLGGRGGFGLRVAGSTARAPATPRSARDQARRRAGCARVGRSRARPSDARSGTAPASAVATVRSRYGWTATSVSSSSTSCAARPNARSVSIRFSNSR